MEVKMKKLIIICIALIAVCNLFAQEENIKNFDYWYNQFLENQKEFYLDGNCELFVLGDVLWQRRFGESKYYLAPKIENNMDELYFKRIRAKDNKAKGISKSSFKFVKVTVNNESKELLSNIYVTVPDYIQKQVIVWLPEIDIDFLISNNCILEYYNDYGMNKFEPVNIQKDQKTEIIWYEDWEGSISQYVRLAWNADAYWGDVSCFSCEGNWSMWCADDGSAAPSSNCSNYIDNMHSSLNPFDDFDLSCYNNVVHETLLKWDMESGFDYLYYQVSYDGSGFSTVWDFTASSGGCVPNVYNVQNCNTFNWRWLFTSDRSVHNYEGAYIDITILAGDPIAQPSADFTGSPTSGCKPLNVNFIDCSTGNPTSWNWNFGDGGTSPQQNPSHTYQNAGTYTVSLTVSNQCGSDTETKTNYITILESPTANFSGIPTSGCTPLNVNFTDLSSGDPTSWNWDFGDGGTSPQQNPSHEYQNSGTYTVSLTVSNQCGSDTKTETDYITVITTGYELYQHNDFVKIYPNPAKDKIFIKITNSELFVEKLELLNMIGKAVYQSEKNKMGNLLEIPVVNLNQGVYFVKLRTSKGIITRKIIIQR